MFRIITRISVLAVLASLVACSGKQYASAEPTVNEKAATTASSTPSLDAILAARAPEVQARDQYRNPKQTIEFFGLEPGMTVIEALPGGGWYSKILLPYLGSEGKLVGVDYAHEMWQHFGGFATAEFIEKRKTWPQTWAADAATWGDQNSAAVSAYEFGNQPESMAGSADAVIFIRALHNLARFQDKGPYLSNAIKNSYIALKPGGIVGVVQHRAREDRPDEWANGSNGYLKQSMVINAFEAEGFELVAQSDINANDKDLADEGDIVWRLPPSLSGSADDADKKAMMQAIGESNRMTLKFRKPI